MNNRRKPSVVAWVATLATLGGLSFLGGTVSALWFWQNEYMPGVWYSIGTTLMTAPPLFAFAALFDVLSAIMDRQERD